MQWLEVNNVERLFREVTTFVLEYDIGQNRSKVLYPRPSPLPLWPSDTCYDANVICNIATSLPISLYVLMFVKRNSVFFFRISDDSRQFSSSKRERIF